MTGKPIWGTWNLTLGIQGSIFPPKHELGGWTFFLDFSIMYMTI